MNVTAFSSERSGYQEFTNNEKICGASTQSATGSSTVSLAPGKQSGYTSQIDPSENLPLQIPVCKREVEIKTESFCPKEFDTKGGVKDHERTGPIKKSEIKKATTELHSAITNTENLEDLTNDDILALIAKGADVNAKTKLSGKKTALHLAAVRGNQRIIELLVNEARADVNLKDEFGTTVMACAFLYGAKITPLIPCMVKAGFDIHACCGGKGAGTMLAHAARGKNWELVELLLANGADPNDRINNNETALHLAVRLGLPEIIDMLMKYKADINAKTNDEGRTALHLVAESGQREILDKLLQHEANANALDNDERTPLYLLTCADGQLKTFQYFMDTLINLQDDVDHRDIGRSTPLSILVNRLEHQDALEYAINTLLQRAADIDAQNGGGYAPLHFAAVNGKLEAFSQLIEKGANMYAKTNRGMMVLDLAMDNSHSFATKILEILVNAKFDVKAPCDSAGGRTIAYAIENRKWKMVDSLIVRGADIDAWKNEKSQYTPLHYAALMDQKDIVRELLERRAKANIRSIEGNTALHYAVSASDWDYQEDWTVRLAILADLIENGKVEINAQNKYGATALHIAASQGSIDMIRELLMRGADFNILDEKKMTAFDHCNRFEYLFGIPLEKVSRKEKANACKYMIEHNADVRGADVMKAKAAEERAAKVAAMKRTFNGLVHKVKGILKPE
ncbi:ankyrin repeat domain-containing protein [Thalassotalea sp. G20_0]|uniref:ankyrin repeat domain-containing protein n=1 Tax=Thalassotalea sp. G20_0 TaxID=2821093 RepID=UPI001ADA48A4|nr:ankyrin repeat domain-containing protein [Thalassotalea sp. G20_0]MBO9496787.1 ankyrin repeat domain-containing protein [Thalassotalea sp. G20_0]